MVVVAIVASGGGETALDVTGISTETWSAASGIGANGARGIVIRTRPSS